MKKSLDWVGLKLLLLMVMMVLLMMKLVKMMMVVVVLQWHPIVAQPVLGGLRHSLKHPSQPSLSLHELLDGWAVLRLILLLLMSSSGTRQQACNNIPPIFPDYSPDPTI